MIISKTIAYLEVLKNEYFHSNSNYPKDFIYEIKALFDFILELMWFMDYNDAGKLLGYLNPHLTYHKLLYENHNNNMMYIKEAYNFSGSIDYVVNILNMVNFKSLKNEKELNMYKECYELIEMTVNKLIVILI